MTNNSTDPEKSQAIKNGLIAIILILTGLILLLKNLDLLPFEIPSYIFSFEVVLILLGTILLLRGKSIPGILLMAIGVYFIAPDMFEVTAREVLRLWPVLLIVLGIAIFIKNRKKIN